MRPFQRGADLEGLSDTLPFDRRTGGDQRRPDQQSRQPGRLLGKAHLRYDQGERFSGRPGRRRDHVQGGHQDCLRDGALGMPLQPLSRRHHRPASLRRRRLSEDLLLHRYHGTCAAQHAVRTGGRQRSQDLSRMVRDGAMHRRGPLPRRHRAGSDPGRADPRCRRRDLFRDRRIRAGLSALHECADQ